MADNKTTTKVEADKAPETVTEVESEETLSLEDLDSMIAAEDPEFSQSLAEIGNVEPGDVDINEDIIDLDNIQKESLQLRLLRWRKQTLYVLKNLGPLSIAFAKRQVGALRSGINDFISAVAHFSLVKKLLFFGLIAVTGVSGYFLYRVATKGLLPHEESLFVGSMAEWAQEKYKYDPAVVQESFYESTRTSQNILLLKKMVVNLRRSSESGPNPMGAFEFLVEGAAAEVVLEIKDREPEIEDLFLRTIEDMTYDQVSSAEGKRLLCERLRKEVNRVLTQGFVRRIFIKNVIVKP